MIHVIASIGVKQGKREKFIEIFKANVPAVLAEDGCIEYLPAVDADSGIEAQWRDESVVTVIEKWETLDALKAHLAAPHMQTFHEQTDALVEDVSPDYSGRCVDETVAFAFPFTNLRSPVGLQQRSRACC